MIRFCPFFLIFSLLFLTPCSKSEAEPFDAGVDAEPADVTPEDIPDITPPGPVTEFKSVRGDFEIQLSWKNPKDPDFAGVKIYRQFADEEDMEWLEIYDAIGENYVDKDIAWGSFYYKAIAYDLAGNYSDESVVQTGIWTRQTVDSSVVARDTGLAVSSDKKVYISYQDYSNMDLRYASNSAGGWSTMVIDSGGNVGEGNAIALDSDKAIHVVYQDRSGGQILKYVKITGGTWNNIQTLDSNGGLLNAIAVDQNRNNQIHISHQGTGLKYTTYNGSQWFTEIVDGAASEFGWQLGYNSAIAVDATGKVHISYRDIGNNTLKYAKGNLGSWSIQLIDSGIGSWGHTAIAVDTTNRVHILYLDSVNQKLKYATDISGAFATVSLGGIDVGGLAMAIDSSNILHIIYSGYGWRYLTNRAGEWQEYLIDVKCCGSGRPSIAVDSNQKVYMSYNRCEEEASCHLWFATNAD